MTRHTRSHHGDNHSEPAHSMGFVISARSAVALFMLCVTGAPGTPATASSHEASEAELEAIAGYWQCRQCTSANKDLGSTVCEICGNAKQATT